MSIRLATIAVATCIATTAFAQDYAIVRAEAPILLRADPSLTPLRVAAVGTRLLVLKDDGDWLQVEFNDPQFGRRIGWVQRHHLTLSAEALRPMDLSVDSPPAPAAPAQISERQQRQPETRAQPSQSGGRVHERRGFWFSAGLGYGALSCENCDDYTGGVSGGLALGGAIGSHVLLGVGTTGWYKSEDGVTLSVGTLDARVRVYPSTSSGFFLTAGAGLGSISAELGRLGAESEVGLGVVLGLGWDIRVGRNVSLSPFWNGIAVRSENADANFGQIGLAVTIH